MSCNAIELFTVNKNRTGKLWYLKERNLCYLLFNSGKAFQIE